MFRNDLEQENQRLRLENLRLEKMLYEAHNEIYFKNDLEVSQLDQEEKILLGKVISFFFMYYDRAKANQKSYTMIENKNILMGIIEKLHLHISLY